MPVPYSKFNATPQLPSSEGPKPPMYAGSYMMPSDMFNVCTLCGKPAPEHKKVLKDQPKSCKKCGGTMCA